MLGEGEKRGAKYTRIGEIYKEEKGPMEGKLPDDGYFSDKSRAGSAKKEDSIEPVKSSVSVKNDNSSSKTKSEPVEVKEEDNADDTFEFDQDKPEPLETQQSFTEPVEDPEVRYWFNWDC